MSITYQIEPVIETVRTFIDTQLILSGIGEQPLPLLSSISQYSFDPTICPILVIDPVDTAADWSRYASGDVQLSIQLHLHEVRLRSGASAGEEAMAIGVLTQLGAAFTSNYRLNGTVQNVVVDSIASAEPDVFHRLGLPDDEHTLFAIATLKMRVIWIENCLAAA